jgi:UDP-N-acetylmuramoylalanine--D-glutamate ligase
MGLGRHGGGVAVTRFLAAEGALLTVTDMARADHLTEPLAEISELPMASLRLGEHDAADFADTELLVVNPAVRPDSRWVELAQTQGARITSEIELLLDRIPCPVIGVTGSNGKTTTATMTGAILKAAGRKVWLGGNLEHSLLGDLTNMTADDWVVLELSSFQLYWLSSHTRLPEISVVTNFTPNHLDWHLDLVHYAAAKRRLLAAATDSRLVPPPGVTVLGPAVPRAWCEGGPRLVLPLVEDEWIPPLRIPGLHNRLNAACAATAARAAGCDDTVIWSALREFAGLPHRLELIAEVGGRRFINDTQATTPEATMAALEAIDGPCWLLCGGADKGASFEALAGAIVTRCAGAACYGKVAGKIEACIRQRSAAFNCSRIECLEQAALWCWKQSAAGDTILLSPACASTDQYRDYRHRAEDFGIVVSKLRGAR